MLFQEAPDAFNRIVLAVVRRVVGQLHRELEVVDKVGDAVHKLGAAAMVFRSIVQIDDQGRHGRIAFTDTAPEVSQAIDHEVTGHFGGRKVEIEFMVLRQIETERCDLWGFALKVMVKSFDDDAIETTSGEEAHPKRCFGVQGDTQHGLIGIGGLVDLMDLVKNGVGLRKLFHGTTFFTRFSPYPSWLSFWRIVSSEGSSVSV